MKTGLTKDVPLGEYPLAAEEPGTTSADAWYFMVVRFRHGRLEPKK